MNKNITFKNLLDFTIEVEENPETSGDIGEQFRALMHDYFFPEAGTEKTMTNFFNNYDIPEFIKDMSSLREITTEMMENFVQAETINDTFAGTVFLSKAYLKTFHPNHTPEYKNMPEDVQFELLDEIKLMNESIINAFAKMHDDIEANKKRTIKQLVALIIKNVYLKHAPPLKELKCSAESIIEKHVENSNELFTGEPGSLKDLKDDSVIKTLIKDFFIVKKFENISEITEFFKSELGRFEKRVSKLK